MEQIFVTFLVVFALFFANSTTVLVALVAKPLVLPTQWSHLQKIVHKPLESDLNFSKTLLQCSNVTVSCVKYQKTSLPDRRSELFLHIQVGFSQLGNLILFGTLFLFMIYSEIFALIWKKITLINCSIVHALYNCFILLLSQ